MSQSSVFTIRRMSKATRVCSRVRSAKSSPSKQSGTLKLSRLDPADRLHAVTHLMSVLQTEARNRFGHVKRLREENSLVVSDAPAALAVVSLCVEVDGIDTRPPVEHVVFSRRAH